MIKHLKKAKEEVDKDPNSEKYTKFVFYGGHDQNITNLFVLWKI